MSSKNSAETSMTFNLLEENRISLRESHVQVNELEKFC